MALSSRVFPSKDADHKRGSTGVDAKLAYPRGLFAHRLKLARTKAGFATARSFSTALQIDENRYSRYERGEVEPNLTVLSAICLETAVSSDWLLGLK